jgi:hypothetical protein
LNPKIVIKGIRRHCIQK